jgi:hypothetical protein
MRTFTCICEARLFFDSVQCLSCRRDVGWCPACRAIAAVEMTPEGTYRCLHPSCGAILLKCSNYYYQSVCNRLVRYNPAQGASGLCDCCRHNAVIPDLSVPGHRQRWSELEAAKRRLFYSLDLLGLPHNAPADGTALPLTFAFMTDALPEHGYWRSAGDKQVYTGHYQGCITINVKEADSVERERLRAGLNEPLRTLIGHFRHEIGHYYWELLVKDRRENAFRKVFGDYDHGGYAAALERYYQQGPPSDWKQSHLTVYASMHPWEDFAECFAFYLTVVAVLDTARHWGLVPRQLSFENLATMLSTFSEAGLAVNELNRERGLKDLVPEVVTRVVREKLAFVHALIVE